MTTIAIVYFSGYGHTANQAQAVQEGAAAGATPPCTPSTRKASCRKAPGRRSARRRHDLWQPDLHGRSGLAIQEVCRRLFEAVVHQAWKDKVAAGFTNSARVNGDKFATISDMWTLAQQHGQIWVGTGLPPANTKAHGPADVNWTAGFAGALAVSPSDASPDEAPRTGDLETRACWANASRRRPHD